MNSTDLKQIDQLLQKLKGEIFERMEEAELNIIALVDKHKADKTDVRELDKRVAKLEQHVY
ncbi:MAG: hypothetical protein AAB907_02325 [Patescibacteria group bacterium]